MLFIKVCTCLNWYDSFIDALQNSKSTQKVLLLVTEKWKIQDIKKPLHKRLHMTNSSLRGAQNPTASSFTSWAGSFTACLSDHSRMVRQVWQLAISSAGQARLMKKVILQVWYKK